MKVRQTEPKLKGIEFDDIKIGDLLTFPGHKEWKGAVFIRIYDGKQHGRQNCSLSSLTMARLDDGRDESRPSRGQTYGLTRLMMTDVGNPFIPILMKGTLNVEEAS